MEVFCDPLQEMTAEQEQDNGEYVCKELMEHLGIQKAFKDYKHVEIQESVQQHTLKDSSEVTTAAEMQIPVKNTVSSAARPRKNINAIFSPSRTPKDTIHFLHL